MTISGSLDTTPLPEIDALPVLGGLIEAGHLELEFR